MSGEMSISEEKKEALAKFEADMDADVDETTTAIPEVKIENSSEHHGSQNVDAENRDPNEMNDYLKIRFHDLIGEPDPEIHSFAKVWTTSFKVYTNTKIWCYRILSVVLAVPLAVIWGLYFACLAFCTVWCCIPCIRGEEIEMNICRRLWQLCLNTFVAPCFEAVGKMFGGIKMRMVSERLD